jgi:2-keto-4-pentenoate hydratase
MIQAVLESQLDDAARVPSDVAAAFRVARMTFRAMQQFPANVPETLDQAYRTQDQAIREWPDVVQGWKVGRILGELVDVHGTDRLIGPIFATAIQRAASGQMVDVISIPNGFCAVEAEYVFELGQDADPQRTDYDRDSALALVADLWTGIEIAGSPLATINDLGPTVVVSDFGNNLGLILGQPVADWRNRLGQLACNMQINHKDIGAGSVAGFPGGIVQSLVFALNCAARRGFALKKGMWVSTGAVTGVHEIDMHAHAEAGFGPDGTIACRRIAPQGW